MTKFSDQTVKRNGKTMLRIIIPACLSILALFCTAVLLFSPSQKISAQRAPDSLLGKNIAEKVCSSCHIVGTSASGVVKADVPSFSSIANRTNQTIERIAGRIVDPHPPMPDLQLTRLEIADVAAYIMTLKKSD